MTKHRHYRKPSPAMTEARKAKSMQGAWRTATDRKGTLPLADAKALIKDPPLCIYCRATVPWAQFSIDHLTPRSRGGSSEPENLQWVCRSCNLEKGDLLKQEFIDLLAFLGRGGQRMKDSVLTRLRASGVMFGRRRR